MKPVLIIDDNPDILSAMEALLLTEGIEPIVARDGFDAFQQMNAGKIPSVILLDNAMPKMNGTQFLAALRDHPKFASIPVYVISASGDFDGSASTAGIAGFIHKPFDPDKVLAIIRRYCEA
jgi:CheY-like chemotaxis protein